MPPKKTKYHRRPDGLIEHAVTIDGKRKHFYGRTDSEIEKKMLSYRDELIKGPLYATVLDEWQAWHDETVDAATVKAYNYPTKQIRAELGKKNIRSIKPADIKEHLNRLVKQDYSAKVIKRYLSIYHQSFAFACEKGYCDNNVAENVMMPKAIKPAVKRMAAAENEEEKIKQHIDLWLFPFFVLMTGCRRGEALAVQFRDIDMKNHVIHITKAIAQDNSGHPYVKLPKTNAGIRDIPLLDALAAVIPKGKPDEYLFGGEKPLSSSEYTRKWKAFQQATGITATAHCLRHSFATMMYEADIDIKQAADILGHKDENLTRGLYEHIRESKRQQAANKLNAHINSLKS